jgi:hypothetical protein
MHDQALHAQQRVLFDQGVPRPLRAVFLQHLFQVSTAREQGWAEFQNGDLLRRAEEAGFSLLVTTDQSLKHQQNLSTRSIAILVLPTTSWPKLRQGAAAVASSASSLKSGQFLELRLDQLQ